MRWDDDCTIIDGWGHDPPVERLRGWGTDSPIRRNSESLKPLPCVPNKTNNSKEKNLNLTLTLIHKIHRIFHIEEM